MDRFEHDHEQAHSQCEQLERFEGVAAGIEEVEARTEAQHQNTISHVNDVLDTTEKVSRLTQESLDNITGGTSYAVVVPQTFIANGSEIPLMIWNRGPGILTGVTVKFVDMDRNFATADHLQEMRDTPHEEVGTLHPGEGKDLRTVIRPDLLLPRTAQRGVNEYWVFIYSQNFTVQETLLFRKGKWALPWAYRFDVQRELLLRCTPREKKEAGTVKPVCKKNVLLEEREFSDDAGEGKPVNPK